MAVVAPIPKASVRIVVNAKPGLLRSWRVATRRFCSKLNIKHLPEFGAGIVEGTRQWPLLAAPQLLANSRDIGCRMADTWGAAVRIRHGLSTSGQGTNKNLR